MSPTTAPFQTVMANSRLEPTNGRGRGRKCFFRILLLLGCGLLAAAWYAPVLVATTSLRHHVPKLLFPLYPGAIEVGEASLDWFSPVVIRNLYAEDGEGHPLFEVSEFSTSEPLWRLVARRSNLGRLKFVEPRMAVSFRSDGSNLEDVVQDLLRGPRPTAPFPDFELEVIGATINLEFKPASLNSTVKPVSMIMTSRRGIVEELELTVGQVPSTDGASPSPPTDWLAFRFGSQPTQDGVAMTPGSKHIRLKAQGWKLDKLLPILARLDSITELSGEIDADTRSQIQQVDATSHWTEREWSWDGRVTLRNLTLEGLAALNRDRVVVEKASLAGRLAAQQGRLSMDRLQLRTELGELNATGDLPLSALADSSPFNSAGSLLGEMDYQIQGRMDLRRLAALLPNTLRVRDGTQITGGQLDLNLKSEVKDKSARHWTAEAIIDGLAGTNHGQAVSWNDPLRLIMQAHRDQDGITVDQIRCQSDFLNLDGNGTLTAARFTAHGDLSRMEASLQQFIDFGLQKLAGRIQSNGTIRRGDENRISLDTSVQVDDLEFTGWQLDGHATIEANIDINGRQIEIAKLVGNLTSLEARSPDWWVKDAKLLLETSGVWSIDRREWSSPQTTLTGTSASCRIDNLLLALKPDGGLDRMTGEAAFRADLEKVSRWKSQPACHVAGMLEGQTNLSEQDSVIAMDTDATITNLVVTELDTIPTRPLKSEVLWREPRLDLVGRGHYDHQICRFSPIETTVVGERLHLTPQILLHRDPALLVLPAEKVLDQIQLSPQLCSSWLKFVAPMLADATQVDGKFSLDVSAGLLPLPAPKTGDLAGVLTIHRAQVRPGASTMQVLGMIAQIQSVIQRRPTGNAPRDRVWMEMPEQPVNFKLANGRVGNQGVTFVIGDTTIKSSGSVGLIDESLDIVLQIPIRDEWVSDKRLLAGLKGQTVQIPVRGTLSQPQIDGRVIGELAAKIGGAALDGVLENQLDDLFQKKLNRFLPRQD